MAHVLRDFIKSYDIRSRDPKIDIAWKDLVDTVRSGPGYKCLLNSAVSCDSKHQNKHQNVASLMTCLISELSVESFRNRQFIFDTPCLIHVLTKSLSDRVQSVERAFGAGSIQLDEVYDLMYGDEFHPVLPDKLFVISEGSMEMRSYPRSSNGPPTLIWCQLVNMKSSFTRIDEYLVKAEICLEDMDDIIKKMSLVI